MEEEGVSCRHAAASESNRIVLPIMLFYTSRRVFIHSLGIYGLSRIFRRISTHTLELFLAVFASVFDVLE